MRDVLGPLALLVSGAALCLVGWTGLTDPEGLLAPVGLEMVGTRGLNEARAAYGGMHLGMGAFLLVAALRPPWRTVALWAAFAFMGGLVCGRALSMAADGYAGSFALQLLAGEGVAAGLAALALVRRRRNRDLL